MHIRGGAQRAIEGLVWDFRAAGKNTPCFGNDRSASSRPAGRAMGKDPPGSGHWNSSSQTPHDHKLAPGAFVIHGSMKRSLLGFPSIVESNDQQTGLNPGVSLVPTKVEPLSGWCEKLNNLFTLRLMGSSFYSCIDC